MTMFLVFYPLIPDSLKISPYCPAAGPLTPSPQSQSRGRPGKTIHSPSPRMNK